MISVHTSENSVAPREVKQRIKRKLANSLKCLQKRYVNSDNVVTSDDSDANVLCCVLESVFVHGLKSKHVKTDGGKRGRNRAPLPQPVFWTLLKTVTHRNVVTELEHLNFINTDVGRCRAWVRLALNDGLMECYLVSLFREKDNLCDFYHPVALLLDSEDSGVLLSYLQGLASLSFALSYKSAVLNEWTTTPLALAGLCPTSELPEHSLSHFSEGRRKGSWDSASQSSGSDIIEVIHSSSTTAQSSQPSGKLKLTSSTLSLETTGSSQLSSSLSSDSLLQLSGMKSPDQATEELWSCDTDKGIASTESSSKSLQETPDELNGGDQTPVSMKHNFYISVPQLELSSKPPEEDSLINAQPVDQVIDLHACNGETNARTTESHPQVESSPPLCTLASTLYRPVPSDEDDTKTTPPLADELLNPVHDERLSNDSSVRTLQSVACQEQEAKTSQNYTEAAEQVSLVGGSTHGTDKVDKLSVPSNHLTEPGDNHKRRSWISDDDICKPSPREELPKSTRESSAECSVSTRTMNENSTRLTKHAQSASNLSRCKRGQGNSSFRVTHRRKAGISNPFRGLLKLGNLERRGHVGIWKEYYCELSPFEFRLYQNDDDRNCYDNCSLLRCESVGSAHSDGRFELVLSGKRLYLRAPSRDEAEDWIDRIREALVKCRPHQTPKQEAMHAESSVSDKPHHVSEPCAPQSEQANHEKENGFQQDFNWVSRAEPQLDAVKETVLYLLTDKTWTPYIFSLSLKTLKNFQFQGQQKILCNSYRIETFKDVIPDTALGSPAYFKLITSNVTLRLRAESATEAKSWRELIRAVLSSFLEAEEDALAANTGIEKNERRLRELGLGEHSNLLQCLTVVPVEKGLDAQEFRCAGCHQQIGFSFGKPKLCAYSSLYFCEMCHQDTLIIIPSRMIHNWDLTQKGVSNVAAKFLQQIQNEPFIDVNMVNGSLYQYIEQMSQARRSRDRLKLLEDYLLTCRSGAVQEFYKKLEQKKYLLESPDLYSVSDLRETAQGVFEAFLQHAIHFATNHVYMCDLCTQRGFICQLCNSNDIIFPFEFESTSRCKECRTVFHKVCKAGLLSCPRCVRKQRYLECKMVR
ncbi:pleckstrin homology domain-containing family M member 1 isoform X1 [Carcharodon carcharias]|uniref:pleckstrin homology domain-containing family M member 1 isoform X1 n=1 Tax=Carcharodon carcharias TaxID=13397 RepID=UPI001B7E3646|nr:pleckstrin homology domain-containing family M member 1 isoform X1 [Carcharodon carcharias]XP_041029231.1 pleckstrin homology domain-containing family M member 1 isoform X1 [Carcharodon carcharias]XP_041029232.1 pleckstrin homology domain-containing family M member 1 isoform X1 [Carcharodon carcharias]